MKQILKELFVKDSNLNRRLSEQIRKAYFHPKTLLISSFITLVLALFAWWGIHFQALHETAGASFAIVIFFAPTFAILSAIDTWKIGWVWSRFIAFLFSVAAFILVIARIYIVVHPAN